MSEYNQTNPMELEPYFYKHMSAMTGERLHAKSDIAMELAYRDKIIEKYKQLAKERGDFIINGEDMGYISVPTSETDKAYHTFMRCKLTSQGFYKKLP